MAPIAGRLGLRQVDAGNLIRSGDPNGLVVITQMRPISVLFTVPEAELPAVLEGLPPRHTGCPCEAWDRAEKVMLAEGVLQTVDNQIDTATGTIKLRAQFANEQEQLFPNQFVNIRLRVRLVQNATGDPGRGRAAGLVRHVRVRREAGQHGHDQADRARARPRVTRVAITTGLEPDRSGSCSKGSTSSRRARRSRSSPATAARRGPRARRPARGERGRRGQAERRAVDHEHLAPVHRAARRHGAADGRVLLSGLLAYRLLPVSALPQVDYPTIRILTFYPGASPEVMTSAVTAPLERQFGQMPGLDQMSSTSSGGASVITLRFALEKPLEVAEQEVQAAINAANSLLPNDLPQPPVYNKVNPADTPVLTLAVTSKTVPLPQVHDLVDTRVAQKLSQLPGVGLVSIAGGQRPAVRIQANPQALAAHSLNLQIAAAGDRGGERQPAEGQLRRPRALVHARRERPAPVARGLQGSHRRVSRRRAAPPRPTWPTSSTAPRTAACRRGRTRLPAVLVNVQRQPGANVIAVVDRVQKLLPQLTASLPSTLQVTRHQRPDRHHPRLGARRAARARLRRRPSSSS